MYLKGVGMTKFGGYGKSSQQLCYEAATEALEDGEMSIEDIDAIIISRGDSTMDGERQRLFPSVMSSMLQTKGIPMIQTTAACSGGGAAVWDAVHSGYENVLVLGVERLSPSPTSTVTDDLMMASERIYEQSEGLSFPAQNALIAQQYMRKFKVTYDDLTKVALKNHENAFDNPKAKFFGRKVTEKMIKKSPVVASPLRLFDCSISVDGAAAAILTKKKTDIEIIGSALHTDRLPAFEARDMTSWQGTVLSAGEAYQQAGITVGDIDFVELHDAFTSVELMAYEDLGLAEKGEGKKLIRKGETRMDGRVPVNMSGGLKAKGHPVSATGVSQLYEIAEQMRGRAGKRQLDRRDIAIAHNVGGVGSTVTVHVFRRIGG